MADERPIHEVLLDYAVYAPVGLLVTVADELPKLTEKGRARLQSRLALAHVVGRLAVGQVRRMVVERGPARPAGGPPAGQRAADGKHAPPGPSDVSGPSAPPAGGERLLSDAMAPATRPPAGGRRRAQPPSTAAAVPRPSSAGAGGKGAEAPPAGTLAIPGYDTLAASQVVQRLSSLEPEELEAVRRYESGTRGRRTILHRIAQLSSSGGRASA